MFTFARYATVVLAAAVLSGCAGKIPTSSTLKLTGTTANQKASGQVQLKLAGLGTVGYHTLATTADIQVVTITLRAGGQIQSRKLSRREMMQPQVNITFNNVLVGKATLEVQAFDASANLIGSGMQSTYIAAGAIVDMDVRVKLAPDQGTGNVQATIVFDDGTPIVVYENEEGFRTADTNSDGRLSYEEFSRYWPYTSYEALPVGASGSSGSVSTTSIATETTIATNTRAFKLGLPKHLPVPAPSAVPVDPPMPICIPNMFSNGDGTFSSHCPPVPMPEPVPPALVDFQGRDLDGDGVLSIDEFLRRATPKPPACDDNFARRDGNRDGVLSFEEWRVDRAVPMMMPIGVDGDAWLKDFLMGQFKVADLNRDGVLDQDEYCMSEVPPALYTSPSKPVSSNG